MRSMTISLDGLLDYDEEDREECTFEVTLLLFHYHCSIINLVNKLQFFVKLLIFVNAGTGVCFLLELSKIY